MRSFDFRSHSASGFITLEAAAAIVALIGLLLPIIGVFDLLLTRQQIQNVSSASIVDNNIKAFRLFSGSYSWYTRAINASDEGAPDRGPSNIRRKDFKTDEYHKRLSAMADKMQRQVRGVFGQQCVDTGDCDDRYRVEVRVIMPYIVHDTGRMIRVTCGPGKDNIKDEADGEDQNGCFRGRVRDYHVDQHGGSASRHRFLRVRGTFKENEPDFGRLFIEEILEKLGHQEGAASVAKLEPYTIPSGLFQVRHAQNYGRQDRKQHGWKPDTRPEYLRHILFLGVRVYVDMAGTPAGFVLGKIRMALRGSLTPDPMDTVLYSDLLGVPRQEF